MIKSNPMPAGGQWYQRSSCTVMKVQNPKSGYPAWGPDKGTENPRESDLEGQRDLTTRLPQDWGKQGLQSWRGHTKPCTHQDSEERTRETPRETEAKLPARVGGSPVEAWTSRGSRRDGGMAAAVWEGPLWSKPSWRSPLTGPQSCGRVTSGQKTTREGAQPHPSADNWIKALLSRPYPQSKTQVFPPAVPTLVSQPLPSEGRQKKQEEEQSHSD